PVPRLRRGRRLRRRAALDRRRLGVAAGDGRGRAAVLAARGRRCLVAPSLRPARGSPARRARPASVLVRGGRVRPLAGRPPPHPGPVGGGRRARPPAPRAPTTTPGRPADGPPRL